MLDELHSTAPSVSQPPALAPGNERVVGTAFFYSPNDPRQNREEDNDDDHLLDVLVDARYVPPEEIADEQHAPDPHDAADDVVEDEIARPHLRRPRHDRRKRANDRHESG